MGKKQPSRFREEIAPIIHRDREAMEREIQIGIRRDAFTRMVSKKRAKRGTRYNRQED